MTCKPILAGGNVCIYAYVTLNKDYYYSRFPFDSEAINYTVTFFMTGCLLEANGNHRHKIDINSFNCSSAICHMQIALLQLKELMAKLPTMKRVNTKHTESFHIYNKAYFRTIINYYYKCMSLVSLSWGESPYNCW